MRSILRSDKTFQDEVPFIAVASIFMVLAGAMSGSWLLLLAPVPAVLGAWVRTRGNVRSDTSAK